MSNFSNFTVSTMYRYNIDNDLFEFYYEESQNLL